MALGAVRFLKAGRSEAGRLTALWPRLLELLLVLFLIIQAVRLMWTILTPVGLLGDWQNNKAAILSAPMRERLFRTFDAFYPAPVARADTQNVTSLALTLFGVRINEGSGLGSAIIGAEDGVQDSYAVGDEIQPGVTLKSVAYDHVIIDRGGVEESIFLDQSDPVTPVERPDDGEKTGSSVFTTAPSKIVPDRKALSLDEIKSAVGFGPRMSNGRITGLLVTPKGEAFQTAGFREGDVITQVNGTPVSGAGDAAVLQQALVPGARVSLMVERGADEVPIVIMVQDK